jgi:hypothetical protein
MAAAIKQHMATAGTPQWQQQQQQQHRRSCSSSSCDIGSSCSANCSMSSCCSSSSAMLKCSSRDLPYSAGCAGPGGGLAVAAVAAAAGVAGGPSALWQQQQHQISPALPLCSMAHQLQQLPGELGFISLGPCLCCSSHGSASVLYFVAVMHNTWRNHNATLYGAALS